jgi:hypothetical protein
VSSHATHLCHAAIYPFSLSLVLLVFGLLYVHHTWHEEGSLDGSKSAASGCAGSLKPLVTKPAIWKLGLVQSLYESTAFMLIFLRTPALDTDPSVCLVSVFLPRSPRSQDHAPLGFIFASFMLAIVTGSMLFRRLVLGGWALASLLKMSLLAAFVSLALTSLSTRFMPMYLGFVAFQLSFGLYLPTMGTMRSKLLPEQHRTALMSWWVVV